VEQLAELLLGGMTVARFDFTTGSRTVEEHKRTLDNLMLAQKRTSCMCAVYCSLGGNVFVVSKRSDTADLTFVEGQAVRLVHGVPLCDGSDVLPLGSGVVELDFSSSFAEGDVVSVHPFLRAGDETAELVVESVSGREVTCRCTRGASVPAGVKQMAINFSHGAKRTLINACDEGILRQFAAPANVDFISFGAIRAAPTFRTLKEMLREWGLPTTRLIAQIDNLYALRDLPNVLRESDVILLARGELGAVVEPEKMFAVQKHVLRMCERVGRPCIVTRLMDSMVQAPRPTRAEATDIANIVLDGADGLLLGLETFAGNFPLKCLETVLAIAREADAVYDYEARHVRQMHQMNVKLAKATDSAPWGAAATSMQHGDYDASAPQPRQRTPSLTVRTSASPTPYTLHPTPYTLHPKS
jgi:pyruvate kinase